MRAGFSAQDDYLPIKMMKQPIEKGPRAGRVFSRKDFDSAKQLYYQLRGWTDKGIPKKDKLEDLGLNQFYD